MAAGPAGAVVELLPAASPAEVAEAPGPGAAPARRWTAGGARRLRRRRPPQVGRPDRAVLAHPLPEVAVLAPARPPPPNPAAPADAADAAPPGGRAGGAGAPPPAVPGGYPHAPGGGDTKDTPPTVLGRWPRGGNPAARVQDRIRGPRRRSG